MFCGFFDRKTIIAMLPCERQAAITIGAYSAYVIMYTVVTNAFVAPFHFLVAPLSPYKLRRYSRQASRISASSPV